MLLLHIWDRNPTTELCENFLGSTSHGYSIAPALRPEGNSVVPWTDPAVYTQNQEFQSTALFPRPLPTHLLGFILQTSGRGDEHLSVQKNGLQGAICMLCLRSLLPSPCPRALGCL